MERLAELRPYRGPSEEREDEARRLQVNERITAAYVPDARSDFVELARSQKGKLFRKRILKFGEFPHPADPSAKLTINEQVGKSIVRNFHDKVCDIVQIPLANDDNRHVEDPLRNIGEVIDVDVDSNGPDGPGVYATMDIRKPEAAAELGKTLLGTSAMLHMNYTDTKTGRKAGPTLLHTLVTNRPYLTDLGDYREIVAASADTYARDTVVFGAQEEKMTNKEELLEALKADHGIDVVELSQRVEELEAAEPQVVQVDPEQLTAALAATLATAGAPIRSGEDGPITIDDVSEAVIELSQEAVAKDRVIEQLVREAETAKLAAAEAEVDGLIGEGRIFPKQRDVYIDLAVNDRERFEKLVPDDSVVQLSERGVTVYDTPGNDELESTIARLRDVAKGEGIGIAE
jgi:hypothetical protein